MGKIISIFTCSIVFLSSIILAQGYFPLQKGNLWQYYETPWYPIETTQILGDTILPNGNTYAVYSGIGMPSRFLRQADAKVYAVDSQGNEFVVFDFTVNVTDIVGVNGSTLDTIRLVEKAFSSGFNQNYWIFTSGYGDIILTTWTVVDSLGIYQMMFEPGAEFTLQGARINGIVRYGTITSISQGSVMLPIGISLMQNYPNPFNPNTTIEYEIPHSGYVEINIFDIRGRLIRSLNKSQQQAGIHRIVWDGRSNGGSMVASGIYFCRVHFNGNLLTKKLALIK